MTARRSVFRSPADVNDSDTRYSLGRRPVIFDILAPDQQTSILPEGLRLVLHTNPKTMNIKHSKMIDRFQTLGGWIEQHWGDAVSDIDFAATTGGFMRMYTGLSNTTNPAYGGTRRETIAYDKYLDLLALFHNNGSVYDSQGNIILQGIIKMTYDGGIYLGWFGSFTVTETTDSIYQFELSANFIVKQEIQNWRSTIMPSSATASQQSNVELSTGPLAIPVGE